MNHQKEEVLGVFDFYKTKENTQDIVETPDLSEVKDKIKGSSRLQILLLSLDKSTISAVSALLKPMYDVHCVKTIGAALALVKTQKIALIIAEQALPEIGVPGIDFLSEVKTIAPNTQRILLAGHLDFAKVKVYLKKGDLFKLIKKPFDNNRIITNAHDAVHLYLENSGSLARAAENLQMLSAEPAIEAAVEPVKTVRSVPVSANPVIIKCKDQQLFDEIKSSYTGKAEFIYAKAQGQAIEILKSSAVKSMIYYFESDNNFLAENDAVFLKYLKKEIPYLSILVIMDKEKTYYQDVMALLTSNVILNYVPYNTKVEKICHELSRALNESSRSFNHTIFLKWPPHKVVESKADDEHITETIKEVTTKVKDGMLTGIQSMLGMFKKRK